MKTIEINNFRCFDHLEVRFATGINLLIGDNASGKTSLLKACKYALNCFFSGFSDKFTIWQAPGADDFRRVYINERSIPLNPIEIGFDFFGDNKAGISASTHAITDLLVRKNEKSRQLLNPLQNIRGYGMWLFKEFLTVDSQNRRVYQGLPLPLIAVFSTHGIHKKTTIKSNEFKEYFQIPSFGYYRCSDTDGLLSHWVRRMLILTEADKNYVERDVVIGSLKRMFGNEGGCNIFCGFEPRINFKDIFCHTFDNRELPVELLSDGYKRLFSIVIDLAFRCALLNGGIYKEEAALKTVGTVLIDEIDLHLHPSLQMLVLKALRNTFPNLQFIVTTHAPMVMSGVKNDGENSVKYMKFDPVHQRYMVEDVETYGMDISMIAESILNVDSRVSDVKQQLVSLARLIDDEKYDEAKTILSELKARFGDRIPELSGFETELFISNILK